MSIKLKQPTMRLQLETLFLFFGKSSDAVEWSCFLLIH